MSEHDERHCLAAVSSANAGPNDPVLLGLQLAQIDFDAVHAHLIELCNAGAPASVPALSDAIADCRRTNATTLSEIRMRTSQGLEGTEVVSEETVDARLRQMYKLMTEGLIRQFDQVDEPELHEACMGAYATKSLTSPQMNFVDLLERLRAGHA